MKFFLSFLVFFLSLSAHSQTQYWKDVNNKKAKSFYWDLHNLIPQKPPAGISKELIYHVKLNKEDSVLEQEITYNLNGQPIAIRSYAAPSDGSLVDADSFYYDRKGLLVQKNRFRQGYNGKTDTILFFYEYDAQGREIMKEDAGKHEVNVYVTVYDSVKGTKTVTRKHNQFPNYSKQVFFYGSGGKQDSFQYYSLDVWRYTTQFEYDTVNNTKTIYLKNPKTRWLRSKYLFHKNGTLASLLINSWPSWNDSRFDDVESKLFYNEDGTVKECVFYINGKKQYLKRHHYIKKPDQ